MPTIESSIATALMARVASLVLSPVHEIAWPNISFPGVLPNGQPKPKPARYLRVSHLPNVTDRLYQGRIGSHQHQGILQIMVCAPLNSGEAGAREIAGLVANHFAAGLKLYSGAAKVKITKRANIASALITDTEMQIPVSISYKSFK